MLAEFQLNHAKKNKFWYLDKILSQSGDLEHEKLVNNFLEKLDEESFALKISKNEFFKN